MKIEFSMQFLYLTYGTKDVLERYCKNLEKKVQLFMDNEEVTLPEVESIVLLNIPYWGGGVKPWQLGTGLFDKKKGVGGNLMVHNYCQKYPREIFIGNLTYDCLSSVTQIVDIFLASVFNLLSRKSILLSESFFQAI